MRLFWKLFGIFCLAFAAIDISHSAVLQWLKQFDGAIVAAPAGGYDLIANNVVTYGTALLLAVCLSALLAWYLHQPVRIMRRAFGELSAGKLDTRVLHLLGSRSDGFAELGRDFDGMAHRLEDLLGTQQRLLREASHELRSPLTRLQTAIGLAQQNPHNIHATLERIENESLRLQAMLENMLILAQMEAGGQPPAKIAIDVVDLLAGIARDARFEAQPQRRDLRFSAGGECVFAVHPELLYRAFENVIRNAVKYTDPDTIVEVGVEYTDAQLLVRVEDYGPGVDAAVLEKIFEPFYRVPGQQRGREGGSGHVQGFGLGLAIARSAIEFHGGTIQARNRAGRGLRVEIMLPR